MKMVDRSGQRFGRLTVLDSFKSENGKIRWFCRCDCGTEKYIISSNLGRDNSTSCGCYKSEVTSANRGKHFMCRTSTYKSWQGMKDRCLNSDNHAYPSYGGRGISIYPDWVTSFENFHAYVGDKPSERHSIDRYPNNDGNYEPGNVRWALPIDQIRNRRNSIAIETPWGAIGLKEAAEKSGISYATLKKRHYRGLSGTALFAGDYRRGHG